MDDMAKKRRELTEKFQGKIDEWGVRRTAWLALDFVCRGDAHSRNLLIRDFAKWLKKHPHGKWMPKWKLAIRFACEKGAVA